MSPTVLELPSAYRVAERLGISRALLEKTHRQRHEVLPHSGAAVGRLPDVVTLIGPR